jgi:hypothetical protein
MQFMHTDGDDNGDDDDDDDDDDGGDDDDDHPNTTHTDIHTHTRALAFHSHQTLCTVCHSISNTHTHIYAHQPHYSITTPLVYGSFRQRLHVLMIVTIPMICM